MKVTSTQEAMEWFLSHSDGTVTCSKDGKEKEVDCYPDAEDFFANA